MIIMLLKMCQALYLTSYTLQFQIQSAQGFKDQGHYNGVGGQLKLTPRHCTLHPNNIPTKYKHPTL